MDNRKAIVERLREIETQEKSGSLCLVHPLAERGGPVDTTEVIRVYVDEGLISAISSSALECRCGQRFLKEGLIDPGELNRLIENPQPLPLGERLVDLGVADPVQIQSLLYGHAFDIFRHALETGFRVESFEPSSLHFRIPLGVDLGTLLLDLARANNRNRFDLKSNRSICLVNEADFSGLPWQPEEIAILGELRQSKTVDDIVETTGLLEDEVRSVLRTFQQLGMIEAVGKQAAVETVTLPDRQRFPLQLLVPQASSTLMSDQVETAHNEHSFASEQFASLKVRLKESLKHFDSQLIGITSPHLKDGKSLVAANLAFSFARDPGRRTVLVDFDLRKPAVDRYLGISLEPGVIGYLSNEVMKPYCFMRRVGALYVMTAGGAAENPVELLSLKKTRELIQYLKKEFDVVVLDTPPLNPIPDTRIISNLVDGLVLVVRQGQTPFSTIEKAMNTIERKKFVGIVFNEIKPLRFHTYYDYSYYGVRKGSAFPYRR